MAYGDLEHPNWKPILKWYFSPYLTTLITAPIFLVMAYVIGTEAVRLVYQTLFYFLRMSLMVSGLLAWPPLLSIFVAYIGIVSIPRLWANGDIVLAVRISAIPFVVALVLVFSLVAELVQVYLFHFFGYM